MTPLLTYLLWSARMGVLPVLGTPNLRSIWNNDTTDIGPASDPFDHVGVAIPLGVGLSALALLTFLGNAMVVHAIRTERKLRTVS